jgi:hypothetical protein
MKRNAAHQGPIMLHAIRRKATVQSGGRIEIFAPEVPVGTQTEVIILEQSAPSKRRLTEIIGQGRGAFKTPEEADAFLRNERDQWT